jgi:uncharacterized protein YndB with AHSA1/START domain
MTEPTMSKGIDPNSVRKVVSVQAPQAVAWRVFTEQMGAWWPLAYYKIGKANAVDAVIEPHVGGRWYERGDDESTCQWGSVLAWEPPSRLVLSWDISADWQYDPALKTELEVRFNADGDHRTGSSEVSADPPNDLKSTLATTCFLTPTAWATLAAASSSILWF